MQYLLAEIERLTGQPGTVNTCCGSSITDRNRSVVPKKSRRSTFELTRPLKLTRVKRVG